jgi:hypothetical protein
MPGSAGLERDRDLVVLLVVLTVSAAVLRRGQTVRDRHGDFLDVSWIASNYAKLAAVTPAMPEPDLRTELSKVQAEPLLPIEKKLIGWSLGIGLTLLIILAIVNHFLPAAP